MSDDAAAQKTLDAIVAAWDVSLAVKRPPVEVPNKGRDDLARLFHTLGFTHGVEIGVKEGEYSDVLLRANPALTLYSVDPWSVRPDYIDPGTVKRGQAEFDRYEAVARAVLAQHGERSQVVKAKSADAAPIVASLLKANGVPGLDFVYIDGHHDFLNVTIDICLWTHLVRPGGIIAGHDFARYHRWARIHVLQVVHAYTGSYGINPWFVVGRQEELPGEVRDHARSFFWVRPSVL